MATHARIPRENKTCSPTEVLHPNLQQTRDCRTRALSLQFPLLLRQGPASRDQLTDQKQCEAATRITTRAKILSIDGPKTKLVLVATFAHGLALVIARFLPGQL